MSRRFDDVRFVFDPPRTRAAGGDREEGSSYDRIADAVAAPPRSVGLALRSSSLADRGMVTPAVSDQLGRLRRSRGVLGPGAEVERTNAEPNFLPAWFLSVGAQRARTVCKVDASGVDYEGKQGSWSGTGFLVSEDVLLTNHHVLNSRRVAENAVCIFDYESDPTGRVREPRTFRLAPQDLFLTSPTAGGLDYTFVRVLGSPGRELGFTPMDRNTFGIADAELANIVQHPEGRLKSVVVQQNPVVAQTESVIHYLTDTMRGSSGAPVFNNAWQLVGLHHASREAPESGEANRVFRNEGIKLSAIAAHLESLGGRGVQPESWRSVLSLFRGTDPLTGFFGALGRPVSGSGSDLENVVHMYRGEDQDIDVGFWNIEHFERTWEQKLDAVARIVAEMNLDVWALVESSPVATKALVEHLNDRYFQDFDWLASEPDSSSSKQTTSVIWNRRTVSVTRAGWPAEVVTWFKLRSDQLGGSPFEAVEGKIFDRYPERFQVASAGGQAPMRFNLVPLHLKAMAEGSKRRRLASRVLAAAVAEVDRTSYGEDRIDWVIGGDVNAELQSGDFSALEDGLVPLGATDEQGGGFSYVKSPYRSLIDHVFLSPNLASSTGADGFFIVARDADMSDFLRVSDHRPVLVRLALSQAPIEDLPVEDHAISALLTLLSATGPAQPATTSGRPYYDAGADAATKEAYYGRIPLTGGTNPDELFSVLSRAVTATHDKHLGYSPSKYLYPWVDKHPDGRLRSIYSGKETDSETMIRADLETEARRSRLRDLIMSEGIFEIESRTVQDILEQTLRYNCEHVVPQSWFGKRSPMKGDLHHLFTCEPRCNSFRGNTPFFDFPGDLEAFMGGCGRSEADGFEPSFGKGIVARATLYFLLRYPGEIDGTRKEYTMDRIQTLLKWHDEEPPGDYERHRNQAIHELQGNRNPLIDHPQIASLINFARGLG